MNKIIKIIIIVFLTNSCKDVEKPVLVSSTPKELVKTIYEAIKKNDTIIIKNHFATELDIDNLINNSSISKKKKNKKINKIKNKIKNNASNLLIEIKRNKIQWDNTSFIGIEYENFYKDSLNGADIDIIIKEQERIFKIKLKECFQTDRGWVIFNNIIIRKPI